MDDEQNGRQLRGPSGLGPSQVARVYSDPSSPKRQAGPGEQLRGGGHDPPLERGPGKSGQQNKKEPEIPLRPDGRFRASKAEQKLQSFIRHKRKILAGKIGQKRERFETVPNLKKVHRPEQNLLFCDA